MRNGCSFIDKPKGDRSLGKPKRIWDDAIKINLTEIRSESRYGLAAGSCGHDNEPSGSKIGEEFLEELCNTRPL
jgi:hypothetical protein